MTRITENIALLQVRIARAEAAAGRPPGSVKLLAVSKKHPEKSVQEAVNAGLRDFGESFWQEAEPKIQALSDQNLQWHFIGRLQSNKTRGVAKLCAWVHTIDRLRVANRLSEQRPHFGPPLQACIQVRLGDDPGRPGVAPEKLAALATEIAGLPRLQLRGLMCLPPQETDEQHQRVHFRRLREYLDALNSTGLALDTLSMGMTADLEAAIAEGATIIRVGTALFGPRPD